MGGDLEVGLEGFILEVLSVSLLYRENSVLRIGERESLRKGCVLINDNDYIIFLQI